VVAAAKLRRCRIKYEKGNGSMSDDLKKISLSILTIHHHLRKMFDRKTCRRYGGNKCYGEYCDRYDGNSYLDFGVKCLYREQRTSRFGDRKKDE
jgi:hypothetical protein